MKKEIKQTSRFERSQRTQTTASVTKRPAQNRIAPPKKTRKTKSHTGTDERDSDWNDCSGSGEVDTKKGETFACPFYRKDPVRFLECINLRLVTIAIVKQHLRRRHGVGSPSPAGRKGPHSLDADEDKVQEEVKIGSLDTIPPRILDDLKTRSDRRISATSQWQQIWTLLFGESNIRPNPLLNGLVKEFTGMIRDIWSKEGSQIVSNYLHTRGISLDSSQLLSLLPELLDKFEGRFENNPLEYHPEEQYSGIKGPMLESAIGEIGGSQKSAAAASQYSNHDLDPSNLVHNTGSTSTVCDSPKAISGVQVSHDFASVGAAFELQANGSECFTTDYSIYPEQLHYMEFLSPVDGQWGVFKEGPLSQVAGSQISPDCLGMPDDYYYNFPE
ncbi:hypothetical protein FMEXI_11879 [Fusarium mexicanum]|uniref:Uncharacterized protein n=1 Tax=Fusarium mexicanum TaxID=751941 RepID=A0A8H5MML9_9HYPO|nr:hypothetical protein FMEXI_11879 [Fusarium mexicanum]